jgi:hypothetical protein
VAERRAVVDREGDAVGAEHLLHEARARARVAEHHRHVAGLDAVAQQGQHLRRHQLDLGALAARGEHAHRVTRLGTASGLLEEAALEVVQRLARAGGVVVGERLELHVPGGQGGQALEHAGRRPEGHPPALVGERHRHIGAGAARERLQRVELERGEVVEPVDEHR